MALEILWLQDFRCFTDAVFAPHPSGLTVLYGPNGAGKTSILEALSWLGTGRSFRTTTREALVRVGTARAVVRAQLHTAGRTQLVEAELPRTGTARVQVNRQAVRRVVERAAAAPMTVFCPEDLALVQGGPAERRGFLDDVLASSQVRTEALVVEVERVLRQRAALLHHAGGRGTPEVMSTLDVWDSRLADAGSALVAAREALLAEMAPMLNAIYGRLAGVPDAITVAYRRSWEGDLGAALEARRGEDLRRQSTGIGPHRDEVELFVAGRPARTHCSQGEQRSLALALRLTSHHLATRRIGEPPVLLLDDVFSELDPARARALVAELPPGQVLLTTAGDPPALVEPDRVVRIDGGQLVGAADEAPPAVAEGCR